MFHTTSATVVASLVAIALAAPAGAQVADHLKCYKIKDQLKLAGTADLDTPQFGLDPGCKISKATLFCVPGTKTNVSVIDKSTGNPITPLPVTGPDPGDRICYKVKCPEPFPPDTEATDQFGTRMLTKFKPFMLCAPAVKGGVPSTPTPIPTVTPTSTLTLTPTPTSTARFVDNGGGTVTDNQTGLQWEKKTDDGGVHDRDNTYTWTDPSDGDYTDPDGTAFTVFLANLNTDPCFAGHCDWRLPRVNRAGDPAELETILLAPYPCGTSPCIDPIFGPTAAGGYWSATTYAGFPDVAWGVVFFDGLVDTAGKSGALYVRAVRSGS